MKFFHIDKCRAFELQHIKMTKNDQGCIEKAQLVSSQSYFCSSTSRIVPVFQKSLVVFHLLLSTQVCGELSSYTTTSFAHHLNIFHTTYLRRASMINQPSITDTTEINFHIIGVHGHKPFPNFVPPFLQIPCVHGRARPSCFPQGSTS